MTEEAESPDLRARIHDLERTARALEPDGEARASLRDPVLEYTEEFLEAVGDVNRVKAYETRTEAAAEIRDLPISEAPAAVEELLPILRRTVDEPGLNPASGGHLAYIPGGGVYASALGDYIAAVLNHYAGISYTGPGAVEMENQLLEWMAELVGYPADAGGNLASGGSIANLIAIVTARDAHGLRAADYPEAVVYLTDQAHHCVDKALRIAGLGECTVRRVSTDERHRMRPDALDEAIREDAVAGRVPWLVIASAGTTDVGAIDPLEPIGRVAGAHDLWYHIDGAYGAFFALCPEVRPRLAGMELSDSIVMDPHKGLFLPYGLGAVLVKDRSALHRAHYYRAAYLQDVPEEESAAARSPAELSPELTKHFRGPRLWLPLMVHGVEPFRACLEEKLLLTRYFWERAREIGFEVGPEPELSVATYRWIPEEGDADAFNEALLRRINEDGRVFLSSTTLNGDFVLRLAVLSFRTHRKEIDLTLRLLEENARDLEAT